MAAITYDPPAGGLNDALPVTVGEVVYTFAPGVALEVPQEHQAACVAAILATVASSTAPITDAEM
jgi:hypothetical protein